MTDYNTTGWLPEHARQASPELMRRLVVKHPEWGEDIDDLPFDPEQNVFLYRSRVRLSGGEFGTVLSSRNQGSWGSCVGVSGASCATSVAVCDVTYRDEDEEFKSPIAGDAMYGLSRNWNLGSWQGSTGAWWARACVELGVLYEHDLGEYSAQRCSQWQRSRLPQELLEKASRHRFGASWRVTSCERAAALLQSGRSFQICSNYGSRSPRDSLGFLKWNGSWSHAMCAIGYRGPQTSRRGFLIWNSWGDNWTSGPVWPADCPLGAFWMEWDDMARVLDQGDSYVVGRHNGFKIDSPLPDFVIVP